MKIQLDYPFSRDYETGYTGVNRENRTMVYLVKKGQSKVTNCTSYARYLLGCKEGRYLTKEEDADHKDNDKTNDNMDNLQILSKAEYKQKTKKHRKKQVLIHKTCPICEAQFIVRKGNEHIKTCSKSCGGKLSHRKK